MEPVFGRICRFVSKHTSWMLQGINLEADPKLGKAIEYAKLEVEPSDVVACAWACALMIVFFSLGVSLVLFYVGVNPFPFLLAGFILAAGLAHSILNYPKRQANQRRIKSLGHAPEMVAYLIIPLKQNPNLENAARFAAEQGEGQMAEDLRKVLWEVWAGNYRSVGEALPVLGYLWGENMAGIEDAMYAIRTSQIEKSETRRLNTLDRALDLILESMQKMFKEFINYLRLPTMILFAGGALFPLVIIILLPLVSFMGMDFGTPINLFIGLMAIVLGVFLFSEYILERRPAAFSSICVPDDYPGLPSPGKIRVRGVEGSAWKISVSVSAAVSILSLPYLLGFSHNITDSLNTLPIIVGMGAGIWVYMRGTALPKKEIMDRMRRMEDETIEAAFHLGNRLVAGMSAEEAFVKVADMMSNQESGKETSGISGVFDRSIRNIRYLNMDLEDSLFDEDKGALKGVYSGMVNSVFRVFAITMKKSILTASEALMVAANHIKQIRQVESSLRDNLAYTTSMIKATALLINPMICALAVYISGIFRDIIENTRSVTENSELGFNTGLMFEEATLTPEILQLITGVYMILIMVVLIRYVSVLESGDNQVTHKLEIARGIPVALAAFIGIIFVSRFF